MLPPKKPCVGEKRKACQCRWDTWNCWIYFFCWSQPAICLVHKPFLGWKLERYIFICWKKIFGPVQLLCCLEFLRTIIKNQLLLLMSRLLNFLLPLNQADTVITLSRAVAFWLQAKWSFSWLLLRRANWRSYMKCIFLFSILSESNCGLHIPLQAIILSWYFSSWAINIDKCWMPTRGLIPMRLSMFSHKVVVNHARIKYTM